MVEQQIQALTKSTTLTTKIPPLAFQNYPVNIYLRIYPKPKNMGYELEILAEGIAQRSYINMLPHDLESLNKLLQKDLYSITRTNLAEQQPTAEELKNQIYALAKVGNYAFKKVFGHSDAVTCQAIQDAFALSQQASIQIVSDQFFLPWELIYPVTLDKPLSYDNFWGMKHIISRVIPQDNRPGAFVSPNIECNKNITKLGLLTYRGLTGVVEKEIYFFKKLQNEGKISLFEMRPLDLNQKIEELKEFKDFWNHCFHLAHFACHAFYLADSPDESYILLSDDFPITLMDMEVSEITIKAHPLIIMNACETGNLNPLYTSNFAAKFLEYGARGVVATECAVPDDFAADFSEQLYGHLLTGKSLGESLLTTRRYFLEKYNNPSGLLYSMYAPPSIRLVQIGECHD